MLLFYLMAALAVVAALGVVFIRHPLYSAFSLIFNMLIIAGLFAQLEAHFLAVTQVIVYAGAIMVLVVFVIMLLSVQGEEREPGMFVTGTALAAVVCFLALLCPLLLAAFGKLGVGASIVGDVRSIGLLLYQEYLFPFEASSLLIMAALVGAVVLAKKDDSDKEIEQRLIEESQTK